jgi:hypothetical protein
MALCNALRDASAFSAQPRPCSGSAGLMVVSFHDGLPRDTPNSTLATVRLTRTDAQRSRASCLLVPSTPEAAQAANGHGAAIRAAELLRPGPCVAGSNPCQHCWPSRQQLISLVPAPRTSSLFAAHLRCLRSALFLLDLRCDSCLRFLAGRRAAALGLRVTCIRRDESSGGLLFFLPLPSAGYNISTDRTSSMADHLLLRKFLLCIRDFYVRCSRTHPHSWERTASVETM